MNVLSLFDGMSCGMIALERLGIQVDNYYASEIDKYAIQVSQANYPDIIQVGDVTELDTSTLPKIDLIMGGSPCQGFSFAGKQLAFDDPRSALFFEFVRCIEELKPKYFLLENVRMKKEYLDVISEYMGVEPIMINSALVSAQNRIRYYWTNIPNIEQPEQRGIVLRDILESSNLWIETPQYLKNYLGDKPRGDRVKSVDEKSSCLTATMHKGQIGSYVKKQNNHSHNVLDKMTTKDGKSYCLTARYQGAEPKNSIEKKQRTMIPVNKDEELPNTINLIYDNEGKSHKPIKVGMNVEQVKVRKHEVDIISLQYLLREMKKESSKTNKQIAEETNIPITKVEHWFRTDSSFAIPSDDIWFKLKEVLGIKTDVFDKQIMEFEYRDGVYESKQRVYSENGKSPTLTAGNKEQYIETHDAPKQIGTAIDINGHDILKRVYSEDGKSPTLNACTGGNREPKVAVFTEDRINKFKETLKENPQPSANGIIQLNNPSHSSGRVYSPDGKSPTLMAGNSGGGKEPVKINDNVHWRKLTPLECERLQTVPDNYTNHVSNTQRYKMLGNGWTIEVISHILKNMDISKGE